MAQVQGRNTTARAAAALGLLCGVIGLAAGVTAHYWKLGATGWFTGGALLTLLALFFLIEGAIAAQRQ